MDRELFIDGAWTTPARGDHADVTDPATGEVVGRTALATPDDVERAAHVAYAAARGWARTHPDERAAVLHDAADRIDAAETDMAEVLTREQGKPLVDSRKEIRFGATVLRYYAEEGRRVFGSLRPSMRSDVKSVVSTAPIGTVAAIVPWNYPVDLYCWKVAPALAAGNAVIAKPPPETPLAVGMVAQILTDAGVPAGVLADLPAGGEPTGRHLVAHPDVAMITVTGSTATGQAIMRDAAPGIKRLSLELGGHTPFVVLGDAEVGEAAAAAVRRSFSNMGQICIAVNRVLVSDQVADDFVEALAGQTRHLAVGHGLDPDVAYGPVLDEAVRARATRHVDDAVARGARVVAGGGPPDDADLDAGTFFLPTVLDDVAQEAAVMSEETYGPIAAVHRCVSDRKLLELTNGLPYGLAAYVYSRDLERAWAFADEVEAGAVGINVNDTTELQAPFGGWKLSGFGSELGPEGLRTYLNTRHIRMRVHPLDR